MDWKEYRKQVERNESPEVKTRDIIELLDAAESALSLLRNIGTGKWAKTPAGEKLKKVLESSL